MKHWESAETVTVRAAYALLHVLANQSVLPVQVPSVPPIPPPLASAPVTPQGAAPYIRQLLPVILNVAVEQRLKKLLATATTVPEVLAVAQQAMKQLAQEQIDMYTGLTRLTPVERKALLAVVRRSQAVLPHDPHALNRVLDIMDELADFYPRGTFAHTTTFE